MKLACNIRLLAMTKVNEADDDWTAWTFPLQLTNS